MPSRRGILGGSLFSAPSANHLYNPLSAPLSAIRDSLWARGYFYSRFNGLSYSVKY